MILWASKVRHRIAPDVHFRSLEPELSGQADRLTASSRKQLRFRHRALVGEVDMSHVYTRLEEHINTIFDSPHGTPALRRSGQ
jgi:hypothetical protein